MILRYYESDETQPNHIRTGGEEKIRKSLQRIEGVLKIGDVELDKSKPKTWNSDQIITLLLDDGVGVGLDEEDISNVKWRGYRLENIIDALLSFNGDKEAKIEHATTVFDKSIKNYCVSKSVVRWVFSNLLEYK